MVEQGILEKLEPMPHLDQVFQAAFVYQKNREYAKLLYTGNIKAYVKGI
jgi:hypothetical protein